MPRSWNRRWPVRTEAQRAAGQSRWRALAERRALAGLTTRGTPPKRRAEHRLAVQEIDAVVAEIQRDYEWLPVKGQVRAIKLAQLLGNLRRKLI